MRYLNNSVVLSSNCVIDSEIVKFAAGKPLFMDLSGNLLHEIRRSIDKEVVHDGKVNIST